MGGIFGGGGSINTTEPRLGALNVQTSSYGMAVPIVYGTNRVAANLIWYDDFNAIAHTQTQSTGGKGGGVESTNTNYTYTAAVMMGLCEGQIAGIGTIWATKDQVTLSDISASLFVGSLNQSPWGYLSTNHPDQALSYKGFSFVASTAYPLGNSANLPSHSFEVKGLNIYSGQQDANPKDIVFDYLTNNRYGAGFPASKLGDLTELSNYCLANRILLSPSFTSQNPAQQDLTNLMQACNTGLVWSEGVLKFIPYGDTDISGTLGSFVANVTPVYDLTDDDFLADNSADPIIITRKSQADAYNQVQIEFLDRANQYNIGVVTAQDQANIDLYGLRPLSPIQMHFVCDANAARFIAQLILQRQLYIRNTYEFTLGWKYAALEPMDLVTLTDAALGLNQAAVRITSLEENESGDLSIIAEEFPQGIAHAATYSNQSAGGNNINYQISAGNVATPAFFEVPAVKSKTGLAVGVAVTGLTSDWGGCQIWVSYDDATYKKIGDSLGGARYGVSSNTISSAIAQTLDVTFAGKGGQLISGSVTDAANLSTLCLIGSEFCAYTTAHLLSANNYALTLANRAAYSSYAASHASGERFIRMDDSVVISDDLDLSMIGKTIYFKFLSYNKYGSQLQSLADVSPFLYQITGEMAKLPPSNVATISATADVTGVTFNWSDITDGDRKDYELRHGDTWDTATKDGFFGSNSARLKPLVAGTYHYMVKARDAFFNMSLTEAYVNFVVNAPNAPTVTSAINATDYVLNWNAPVSTFNIDHYEIRIGSSWSAGTIVGTTKSTVFQNPIEYSGTVNYLVAAVDIAGNVGHAGSATIVILPPSAPTITTQVIDNNILLYWNDVARTLPIKTYELRKGLTFESAAVIGTKNGLFTNIFETAANTYTYWVVGIDTAGNYGSPTNITATIAQPPDYSLKVDFDSILNGTLSNAKFDAGVIVMPINTTESFSEHFTTHSWSTPQDQINAGFPIYIEPAHAAGYYEEVLDLGALLASSTITVTPTINVIDGSPIVSSVISISTNGTTWQDYPNASQVYGANFRYIKVRISVTETGGNGLISLSALNIRLDEKLKNDSGQVAVNASDNSLAINSADAGGTVVLFKTSFTSISSITLTAQGTTPLTAIYDFIGATTNPTGFKVYLYNSAGARVSGTVSWSAKGY